MTKVDARRQPSGKSGGSTRWDDDDDNATMTLDKGWSTTYDECIKTLPCDETQPHTWPFKYYSQWMATGRGPGWARRGRCDMA